MRGIKDPVMWSNFLFILNAVLRFVSGHIAAALLIGLTGLASFAYHAYREDWYVTKYIDICLAHIALFYTVWVTFPRMSVEHTIVLGAILWIGLRVKREAVSSGSYDMYHTMWHFRVFVGQALLAYIYQAC